MYFRYLKKLYERSSAAWRREMRKNPKPCQICGDHDSEVTPEEMWLCREHKAVWKVAQPYKSHAQRLTEMKIPFLSEADFAMGLVLAKKKKRREPVSAVEVKSWDYSAGRAKPPVRRKK